jgi:8-oxo-dGTP pyrophosphatase MutT (NUDIX family)
MASHHQSDVEDFNQDLGKLLSELSKKLPHFPDGRIDYTNAKAAPVVDCFLRSEDKLLILQRSDKVGLLKLRWNMISGYLDELGRTLREKAYMEIEEETGISRTHITNYTEGRPYKAIHRGIGKTTWYVYPVLADLDRIHPVKLDWEHTSFAWVKPEELSLYDPKGRIEFVLSRILDR